MEMFRRERVPLAMYEAETKNIIEPGRLELEEQYVFMMAVTNLERQRLEAVKLTAEVYSIEQFKYRHGAIYGVVFEVYDAIQNRHTTLVDRFNRQGRWLPSARNKDIKEDLQVAGGYFADTPIELPDNHTMPSLKQGNPRS